MVHNCAAEKIKFETKKANSHANGVRVIINYHRGTIRIQRVHRRTCGANESMKRIKKTHIHTQKTNIYI